MASKSESKTVDSSEESQKKNETSQELGKKDTPSLEAEPRLEDSKSSLSEGKTKKTPRNIGLVLDIPLRVTAELGRTRIAVRDLLNMGQGSIIELNKLAGEPMEIFVNEKLVAKGEAVVVNEKFGVRLIDIISPAQRVEQLK